MTLVLWSGLVLSELSEERGRSLTEQRCKTDRSRAHSSSAVAVALQEGGGGSDVKALEEAGYLPRFPIPGQLSWPTIYLRKSTRVLDGDPVRS